MKKNSYSYRQQGCSVPALVCDFAGSGLDLCEGLYPPVIEFEINHPDIRHLWLVWQMLRKLEDTSAAYVERLMDVFARIRRVRRVLKPSETFWLNIGDSYAGSGRGKGDVNHKGLQQKTCSLAINSTSPTNWKGIRIRT